jgi:hypothetical protein
MTGMRALLILALLAAPAYAKTKHKPINRQAIIHDYPGLAVYYGIAKH